MRATQEMQRPAGLMPAVSLPRFDHAAVHPQIKKTHLVLYYAGLLGITLLGIAYGFYFSELNFPSSRAPWIETVLNLGKLAWLIPLPYALLNFYSFFRYPIIIRPIPPPITHPLKVRLYVRIVTRGQNPHLVAETARRACRELEAAVGPSGWTVEIVSDNPLDIDSNGGRVVVIQIPASYRTPSGAKYKARALEYVLGVSDAAPEDWIIHLDEETAFDADAVRAIHAFILKEDERTGHGSKALPNIGQGVILYGRNGIVNWLTTLADSIRVGDDYGRFRLQFEHGKAWFGMHGSFIVIQNGLEQAIGFDHGPQCSITEDCYFAMVAQRDGVRFEFIHAFMDERSPFTVADFARQRRRWFGGLWLCVLAPELPLISRLVMGTFMLLWSLSWLCIAMVYLNFLVPTGTPVWLAVVGGVSFFYYVSLYILGYLRTFDPRREGWFRYIGRFVLQVVFIPVFSLMEAAGVLYGLISPPRDFFVVQKEISAQGS